MKESDFYVLYSHNVAVKGKDKSAIYNLHKGKLTFVPNTLVDVIDALRTTCIAELRSAIATDDDRKIFDDYLFFLEKHRLGMFIENPEQFPPMEKIWKNPYEIISAITEFDCFHQHYDLTEVLMQLDRLTCNFLEIRLYNTDLDYMRKILKAIYYSGIRSINLVLEYMDGLEREIAEIYTRNPKLECILVFKSQREIDFSEIDSIKFTSLTLEDEVLHIDGDEYIINTKYFMEAQHHHPYFNRKVVIDRFGNLKNDLSFRKIFGNVNGSEIAKLLAETDYKDLWTAHPDNVIDYQNDPLRYCRIYTDNLKKVNGVYTVDKD